MYVLTERLLSFNRQRFTLHKNEKRNLELYRKIPSSTNLLNYPPTLTFEAQFEKMTTVNVLKFQKLYAYFILFLA